MTRHLPVCARALLPRLWTVAALCALAGAQLGGCIDAPAAPEPGPVEVVEAIHQAWADGDLAAMHASIDYRFRLVEAVGELWEPAPEEDRARLVELAQGMFVATMRSHWDLHVAGRELLSSVQYERPDVAWVQVEARPLSGPADPNVDADHEGPKYFAWRYRLHRRDESWRVTQREYLLGYTGSSTDFFFPRIIGKTREIYGRTPTLAELNANLPSLQPTLKKRAFQVRFPE